jgi:hypothetical protein
MFEAAPLLHVLDTSAVDYATCMKPMEPEFLEATVFMSFGFRARIRNRVSFREREIEIEVLV